MTAPAPDNNDNGSRADGIEAALAALRADGAAGFDPVGVHFIEALARRMKEQQGAARRMLEVRLQRALAAVTERFDHARRDATERVDSAARLHPEAEEALRDLLAAGDFRAVRRLIASLETGKRCAALGALVRELERAPPGTPDAAAAQAGSRPELKAIRQFRSTWSRLSVEKQVTQALGQAPKNAGPINSHMLVLRSLASMRAISPDYLSRFMTYAETLLSLDGEDAEKSAKPPAKPKRRQTAKTAKK